MRLLIDSAPVAMAMFDTEMRYLLANRRWLEDFKLANVDVTGRSHYDLFPSLHPGWRHVYERALGGQIVRSDRDAVTQHGEPVLYRWEVRPWRHADTTIGGVMISCERLLVQPSAGLQSEMRRDAESGGESLWHSPLPLLAMTAEGSIVRSSRGAAALLGGAAAAASAPVFWEVFGTPQNREVLRKHVLASLDCVLGGGRTHTVIFTEAIDDSASAPTQWLVSRLDHVTPGSIVETVLAIGLPGLAPFAPDAAAKPEVSLEEMRKLSGEIERMHAALLESSDAASAARQREARLRSVLELAPCGLVVLDEHARPIYHNTHVAALLGRELREGASIGEWLAEGARDEAHKAEISRRWTEGVWRKHLTLPLALTAADGALKEIEVRPVLLPGGGLLVLMQDVTDARRSEEMLRSTEAKYRTLVHESPVPVILADRTSAVFDVNPAAESFLGHTRAELRRMNLNDWLDEASLAERSRTLRDMQEHGGHSATLRVRVLRRDGSASPAELRLALVTDAAGQLLFSIHFLSPGAERKPVPHAPTAPAVQPLRTTQTQALLLLATDVHGRIQEWSDDATERFGYESSEVVGHGLHLLFRPSDPTGFYAEMLALGSEADEEGASVEWTYFHKRGGRQTGPFLVQKRDRHGLAGSLLEEVTVMSPVVLPESVEPVAEEEEISSASTLTDAEAVESDDATKPVRPSPEDLSRERLLLGEAHHRVKNHLQIITSMLNLQVSTLHNEEARNALRSSQNRVRSIAALHQHLHQIATGASSDFRAFATGLVAHLRDCYEVDEDRVKLQLTAPEKPVPDEWLMPLALSLNEMISNAFKHAFPGNREGSMRVTLSWDDHEGELSVADDGVGLPSGFTHHDSTGLGLKILRVFAGQMGGEVTTSNLPGQDTIFRLTFPVASEEIPQQTTDAS